MATIPIFLMWLYLVWCVILFGASLASSLATFGDSERALIAWPERLDFQLLFRIVGYLSLAQRKGAKLSDTELLVQEPHSNERQLQYLLHRLEESRIAVRDEDGDWLLSRDLEELTLSDLYCSGNYHLPIMNGESVPVESDWDRVFAESMLQIAKNGQKAMDRPLRQMYRSGLPDEGAP